MAKMVTVSLLKALTSAGIGSRRQLADAIKQGRVEVNGEVVAGFNYPVNIATDRILIDKQPVDLKGEPLLYLILNKPPGILSTMKDERGRRTVTDILPRKYRHLRLYPVGRLDKDSTGLLLITNDGNLTHELTHPSFEHEKEYLVQTSTRLRPAEKRKLERGIKLADGLTHPALVKEVPSLPAFTYRITIHEGRKRQLRRMFHSIGHQVLALKRVRLGNLTLGELEAGKTRELSIDEVRRLLRSNTKTRHDLKAAAQ